MKNQALAQGEFFAEVGRLSLARQVRQVVRRGTVWLPPILRPGLAREAVSLAAAVRNRRDCVRGLYFRRQAPAEVEFRNGVRWASTRRDSLLFLLEEIVANRCYTPRWFYTPGAEDVVVDVGANIGVFAAHIISLARDARVVCFEPDPLSYETLVRNVTANRLESRVQAHQKAVWREEGVLYLAQDLGGKSVGQRTTLDPGGAAIAVKCLGLKEALEIADPSGGPIALLKIDVEGAETDILEGVDGSVMRRVKRVALEYHSEEKRRRSAELLRSCGFAVRVGRDEHGRGICLASRIA